ncbi:DNA replication licensing factor mcm5 [Trichoplax sp. H2]|nr:DNA replication licensing factor mcm5 [Trichoplax sp. H2]|eukprot:RDD44892.1 DNA replication licensing factor mcm5 [Trichoplax sp. H2]
MAGFDDPGVFFSDSFAIDEQQDDQQLTKTLAQKKFKEFIREYHEDGLSFRYRDDLRKHYNMGQYWLEVDLDDLRNYDDQLADHLIKQPSEYLPSFESAAKEMADEVTKPRLEYESEIQDIQIMLKSDAHSIKIRDLKSDHMSKLVKISGIVISSSSVRAKATHLTIQCRSCRNFVPNIAVRPGLEGYALPRRCTTDQSGGVKCPLDPYFIVPDKCKCVDFQVLKLQETPEAVPNGEMPRHMQLYCDRYLTEKVVPGNRVTIMGIYSIKKQAKLGRDNVTVGIRKPYLRIVGIELNNEGPGRSAKSTVSSEEEEQFRHLAARDDIHQAIAKSIAPSIYGSEDIKKAIACLLFGGSRKRLPDGLVRRGDINVLLLGDPGTAKSQLLKFVEQIAPIGVYTSGKGSSAAGLTASVVRDPSSRNFIMEGGAMVLADGGVVCIDEFDKMREQDRVAIHEAMEQQTISIAKAGITTTLNSRTSVLAAANSVFGRWDETKGDENIDFMPTILSRFDMIFIVKDQHDEQRDTTLARHILQVHLNALQSTSNNSGELDLNLLKRYINYCRSKCGPRLSDTAAEKLKNCYVRMRGGAQIYERENDKRINIPITVRQLEAVIRMSESLAKMSLSPFAVESHVDEALRLFQVSTLDAAMSGSLTGAEGFTPNEDQEEVRQVETQLKRRLAIGSQVSEQRAIQDFLKQKFSERAIRTVLHIMLRRGELEHRMQRKVIFRAR